MILDLLVDENEEISADFTKQFSRMNIVKVYSNCPVEAQVARIEDELGKPSIQNMLVYSKKYSALGVILSRRYINSSKLGMGPLKIADTTLSPDHVSSLPNQKRRNRVLFLAPHCDEAYIAAVLPHKMIGDELFLYTFTYPNEEKENIESAYSILGLAKDDYSLGSLCANNLYREKKTIRTILESLLEQFNPTVVVSVFPKGASFDHSIIAQIAKDIIINQSKADLLYGYVIQSRKTNPTIFPILPVSLYQKVLQAFGNQGFGKIFENYLSFMKHYMQTLSEPLFRITNQTRHGGLWSVPLEAERITDYRIPRL